MKKLTYLFVVSFLVFYCREDNETTTNNYSTDSSTDEKLLVKKIVETYSGGEHIINFTYDGNKLIKITVDSDIVNDSSILTYDENDLLVNIYEQTGNLPTDNNNVIINTSFNYNFNNELVSYTEQYDGWPYAIRHDVSYNENNDLIIKYYKEVPNNTPTYEGEVGHSYENKNRIREDYDNNSIYISYNYDNSNGLFKNIHAIEVLRTLDEMLLNEIDFNTGENNPTNIYEEDGVNDYHFEYEYTYNDKNYPIKAIFKENGVVDSTIEYFYE